MSCQCTALYVQVYQVPVQLTYLPVTSRRVIEFRMEFTLFCIDFPVLAFFPTWVMAKAAEILIWMVVFVFCFFLTL